MKKILAWIGVILLVLLYLLTLISAIIDSPFSKSLFFASVTMTIVLPVLIYGYRLIYKVLKERYAPEKPENVAQKKTPEEVPGPEEKEHTDQDEA